MSTTEGHAWRTARAARFVGCTPDTLRSWAAAGDVPSIRTPDGQYRFSEAELHEWLESRRVKS